MFREHSIWFSSGKATSEINVNKTNIILAGEAGDLGWVRCVGKGSFMNSPRMKAWVDERIERGCVKIVIDLQECTGMDSTFMGTMAGMAMRLMRRSSGKIFVVDADVRNEQSLEDLGLGSLLCINPVAMGWEETKGEIRASLMECTETEANDRTQHVYDAHKRLVDADGSNNAKFSTVLDCLEAELKQRVSGEDGEKS